MSNLEFLTISIVLAFVVSFTWLYIRDLRKGKDSLARKTGRWLKNLYDSVCGLG